MPIISNVSHNRFNHNSNIASTQSGGKRLMNARRNTTKSAVDWCLYDEISECRATCDAHRLLMLPSLHGWHFLLADQYFELDAVIDRVNRASAAFHFTCEKAAYNRLHYLGALLNRKAVGSIRRQVQKMKPWISSYTDFHIYIPMRIK